MEVKSKEWMRRAGAESDQMSVTFGIDDQTKNEVYTLLFADCRRHRPVPSYVMNRDLVRVVGHLI